MEERKREANNEEFLFWIKLLNRQFFKLKFRVLKLRKRTSIPLLLLQSALQPLWVVACSTVVEDSQQEGFYRVPLPAARQTPQLGGPVIRTFQLPSPGVPYV